MSKRYVSIQGSARWNQLIGSTSNLAHYLTIAFRNAGFDVVSLRAEDQSIFNNNIDLSFTFNVLYEYGNQHALSSTKQLLENFTYNSVLGNGDNQRIIDQVNLRVTHDAGIPTASQNQNTDYHIVIEPPKSDNPKSSNSKPVNVGTIATVDIPMDGGGDVGIMDSIANYIGVSKNTALIGVIVVGAIILKNR